VLAGACLDHYERAVRQGLRLLEDEATAQLLTDGGHISRNPEALLHAFRAITVATDALLAGGRKIPEGLKRVQHRIAPMLRFFRHGDGALALFNGGHEGDARAISGLLARDDVREQPLGYASASAFHRLAAGATIVVMDCGTPPPLAFAADAHAGCLSFELSSGGQRIVVNCGSGGPGRSKWRDVLAATAAHSTITVSDTSSGTILAEGIARRLLGPRLVNGPSFIRADRSEDDSGVSVQASHDGYAPRFGIVHERRLLLSRKGNVLSGTDRLTPPQSRKARSRGIPFAVRFHIHPDIRIARSQDGGAILRLPHGEAWRFSSEAGSVEVEESVYVGTETVRRSAQLSMAGEIGGAPVEVGWSFERLPSDDAGLR
ncbi:MAG: heparinase II/III family protein, partial [Alphaproteobacteria bacterium]|nr:heparinase II/III family protein [Alphaproteobacteria bacterium]